ncbi:hypothetical protein B0H10DRAFT_408830 [Mycena sp. CBHHK59/15]|nr:hypothetical protein B0H10DRAFT_408830 [Mycena sp. CBHHK59/15]
MRSTTPRPTQPTITVSLPPDNLEGYEGMFTLPNSSSGSDRKDPQLTPTQPIHFPTVPSSDSQIRQSDSDSTVKRRGSRTPADERSSSRASRTSRRHVSTPARQLGFDSTDAEDSEAVMSDTPKASPPMNTGSTPTAEKRRTLATMPYNFSEKAMSQPRSIMKNTSERSNRAPAFPPPPPTDPPALELPMLPSTPARKPTSSSLPLGSSVRRPRAQTLTSVHTSPIVPPPPSSLGTVPSRRTIKFSGGESALIPPAASLSKKVVEERTGKENFDIDTATPEQLRQALLLRNQQFDELASYLLKITEAHVAEKHALQKKVAALEQDATRRENEIKGLTWLVMNNRPGSSGSVGGNAAASKSDSALEDPQRQPQSGAKPSPSYSRASLAEDSGAESHQTASGAEESSYRESGSGTSGGESSLSSKARKVKRSHTLMSSFYRTSSTRGASGLGLFGAGEPGVLSTPSTPSTKRSSISSVGSSSSSSRSSLALTNLTPATTVSSLSAIPESASASASVPAKPPKPSQDPLVAAAILATESQRALATESQREKEERRASRVAHRVSTASSVNSITPSASASYSANLKRTRPPSIAQVLAQSPRMEHGRDRLRFSGTSGSASS